MLRYSGDEGGDAIGVSDRGELLLDWEMGQAPCRYEVGDVCVGEAVEVSCEGACSSWEEGVWKSIRRPQKLENRSHETLGAERLSKNLTPADGTVAQSGGLKLLCFAIWRILPLSNSILMQLYLVQHIFMSIGFGY